MIRFAILYFFMLVLFVVLLAAPLVIRDMSSINMSIRKVLWSQIGVKQGSTIPLLQPLDQGLNDTKSYYTGSHLPNGFSSHAVVTPTAGDYNFHRMI